MKSYAEAVKELGRISPEAKAVLFASSKDEYVTAIQKAVGAPAEYRADLEKGVATRLFLETGVGDESFWMRHVLNTRGVVKAQPKRKAEKKLPAAGSPTPEEPVFVELKETLQVLRAHLRKQGKPDSWRDITTGLAKRGEPIDRTAISRLGGGQRQAGHGHGVSLKKAERILEVALDWGIEIRGLLSVKPEALLASKLFNPSREQRQDWLAGVNTGKNQAREVAVLRAMDRRQSPTKPEDLKSTLGMPENTILGTMRALEQRGLLKRLSDGCFERPPKT